MVGDGAGAAGVVEVVDGDGSLVDPDHVAPAPADLDSLAPRDVVEAVDLGAGLLELGQCIEYRRR